jgi:hypothetical protein
MRRKCFSVLVLCVVVSVSACQAGPDAVLPTLAVLDTATFAPTAAPTLLPSPTAPAMTTAAPTPTITDTAGPTAVVTATFTPSATFNIPTNNPTLLAQGTATARANNPPIYATFTPPAVPPIVTVTPQVLALMAISELEFQTALTARLGEQSQIQRVFVDFRPQQMIFTLTANTGSGIVTAEAVFDVLQGDDLAQIQLVDIRANGTPPAAFVEVVTLDFTFLVVETLEVLIDERVGVENNPQTIRVTDQAIELELRVPAP